MYLYCSEAGDLMNINKYTAYRVYSLKNIKKAIFFNVKNRKYIILEGLSAELFELLYNESESKLSEWCCRNEINQQDIVDFVAQLKELDILDEDDKNLSSDCDTNSEKPERSDNDPNIVNLLSEELFENGLFYSFHLDLTNKCNARCIHCYHTFDKYDYSKEIPLSKIKSLIDTIYDLGVFSIVLSGGEALLRDDFFDILEYISNKGMLITLFTNGMLLSEETVQKLALYRISVVSISVYGHNAFLQDTITSIKGSFEKTLKGIEYLKKNKIEFDLKCVMLKENATYITEISDFCKQLNYNRECILDFTLSGKIDGDCCTYDHKISYECLKEIYYSSPDNFIGKLSDYTRHPNSIPCGAGRHGLYCSADGKIYPCVGFRLYLCDIDSLENINDNATLKEWQKKRLSDFTDCFKHTYCKYCLEQCAGNNLIENSNYLCSAISHCERAKIIEEWFSKSESATSNR